MTSSLQPDGFFERGLNRLVRRLDMDQDRYAPGLEGIVAAETAVSCDDQRFEYRGYSVEELLEGSSFLEVAYLLMHGELPDLEHFADFESIVLESSTIDPALAPILESLPLHVSGVQVLRTAISVLGNLDPQLEESAWDALIAKSTRLIAQIPSVVAMRSRIRNGHDVVEPHPALSYAANLFYMVTGQECDELQERTLDRLLILNAEYGFNSSTFATRVVASCGTDLYGAILAGVSTLDGDWAECPYESIAGFLNLMERDSRFDEKVQKRLEKGLGLPGFRCAEDDKLDVRAALLRDICREVAEETDQLDFELRTQQLEQNALERMGGIPHSGWYTCRLLHYLGFASELAESLFVVSRLTGWIAHALEQVSNNCRVQPVACYVGHEKREYIPLDQRAGN